MRDAPTVDVIVPVYRRPHRAKPFMESLRSSRVDARAIAVCDDMNDWHAWLDADADHVALTNKITFAEKVNEAYKRFRKAPKYARAEWVLLVGDDVHFHAGWFDEAMSAAGAADVIAVNDLCNHRCMRGKHATHPLIRRSYIDEIGSSFDGPGVVCHEGYVHGYVDDEISEAAHARKVFGAAPKAIVEHLHPMRDKAPIDDTYRRGWLALEDDKQLFMARKKAFHAHSST